MTDVNGQEKSGEKPAKHTLWKFNIAMENGPFIDDLAIKRLIFHSYVSLPDGKIWMIIWIDPSFGESKIG